MVVKHKVIELKLLDAIGLDLPEKERTNRVVAHQTVKETFNSARGPNKFSLNCRKDILLILNALNCLIDRKSESEMPLTDQLFSGRHYMYLTIHKIYFTRSLGRRQTGTLEQGSPNMTLRATFCNSVVALV